MRTTVSHLIADSFSIKEAQAFLNFSPSKSDIESLRKIGHEILANVPAKPGGCALLSALWTFIARFRTSLPVYVIAGRFSVGESVVFGKNKDQVSTDFDESDMDWDGHCWITIGDYIGDISIFRTAYSKVASSSLRNATLQHFGGDGELLLAKPETFLFSGFTYIPWCVLPEKKVETLAYSAEALLPGKPAHPGDVPKT